VGQKHDRLLYQKITLPGSNGEGEGGSVADVWALDHHVAETANPNMRTPCTVVFTTVPGAGLYTCALEFLILHPCVMRSSYSISEMPAGNGMPAPA
jgi:hypothetical protein